MPNRKNKNKPHLGTWLYHCLKSVTKPLASNEQQDTMRAYNSSNKQWEIEKKIIFSKWWKK